MVVAGKTVTVQIGKEMHKIMLADCISGVARVTGARGQS